ncbi:MAG: prepilin-type N-terminal cleavage/methylation domain-containing protein [Bifidobacteriaceae bacterium]|jgi:prepilin-type N-terminal cleavage/methylation domain-containing protein|nr:prepilin-type N-terminal cleavage/methylation domain-containing protein [Bifidobacteriaceae bacterium]
MTRAKGAGRLRRDPEAGMTLAELIVVIAISSIVLSMIGTVTVTLLRSDGRNLVREARTAELRKASAFLGEALTFASSPQSDDPDNPTKHSAILTAQPTELKFTSAIPTSAVKGKGALSEITIKLGSTCWTNQPDPGVLHQCVHEPYEMVGGDSHFCAYADVPSTCSASLFHDTVAAREVVGSAAQPIFAYYLGADPTAAHHEVPVANLGSIEAIELRVTVAGTDAVDPVQASFYKYYSINEWSRI